MLIVSEKIALKLKTKHNVSIAEVYECLANLEGNPLEDTRACPHFKISAANLKAAV